MAVSLCPTQGERVRGGRCFVFLMRFGEKGLLVVVWLVVEDGESAVELLHEKEAHHLVVEGHLRQGYLVVGGGIDGDVAEADFQSDSAEPGKRKEGAPELRSTLMVSSYGM